MTIPHVDYLEARFGDTDSLGVRLLLDPESLTHLLTGGGLSRLARLARLPRVHGPIAVYPDFSPKPFGFPAGIVLRTEPDWAYPLSAPDMGCGYLVLDTGIEVDPDTVDPTLLESAFQELVQAVALSSPDRQPVTVPVADAMQNGLACLGPPEHFSADAKPGEESNSWTAAFDLLDSEFVGAGLQRSLGSAAGHFVACYVVERPLAAPGLPEGRVLVVVHVGAAPIRDHLNGRAFYAQLAEQAVDTGVSVVEDAADGFFAVDLTSPLGAAFVGIAMAARNFGYVNRQLAADRIAEILRRRFSKHVVADATQVRHVDHVAFEFVDGVVRSRRGLQPLHPDRLTFITGGEHSHAYLAATGPAGGAADDLCCHGCPVRETTALPSYAWDGDFPGADPQEIRRWSGTMASNTSMSPRRLWSDFANLETTMAYLKKSGIAWPVSRLRQFMNYREAHL